MLVEVEVIVALGEIDDRAVGERNGRIALPDRQSTCVASGVVVLVASRLVRVGSRVAVLLAQR